MHRPSLPLHQSIPVRLNRHRRRRLPTVFAAGRDVVIAGPTLSGVDVVQSIAPARGLAPISQIGELFDMDDVESRPQHVPATSADEL